MSDTPEALTGWDAKFHDALAECGRLIEEMPLDERKRVVDSAWDRIGFDELTPGSRTRDFVVGTMIVAHQRRIFDQEWQAQQ